MTPVPLFTSQFEGSTMAKMEPDKMNVDRCLNILSCGNSGEKRRAIDVLRDCLKKEKAPSTSDGRPSDISHGDTGDNNKETDEPLFSIVFPHLLRCLHDPVEKCRSVATDILTQHMPTLSEEDIQNKLPYLIPALSKRLTGGDNKSSLDPSEEVRLQLYKLLECLVCVGGAKMSPYAKEVISMLCSGLRDPYPDVRKSCCFIAFHFYKTCPANFHQECDMMVNSLLKSMSHQHHRVRVVCIKTLGLVLEFGTGKPLQDVVLHLAQRLFDRHPSVRMEVAKVAGGWLLRLKDRYSHFHRIMPLLLTCLTDESPEIREEAKSLWLAAGRQYSKENENDFKDEIDYALPSGTQDAVSPDNNHGCRALAYRNLGKIVPPLMRDLCDWCPETRIKSAKLLYTLVVYAERNVTQYAEQCVAGMCKCLGSTLGEGRREEEEEVTKYVAMAAQEIGRFVHGKAWCGVTLGQLSCAGHAVGGHLRTIAALLRGMACRSEDKRDGEVIGKVANAISDDDICRVFKVLDQKALLECCAALMTAACDKDTVTERVFLVGMSVLGLSATDAIKEESLSVLKRLAQENGMSWEHLLCRYGPVLVKSISANVEVWTATAYEWMIFLAYLKEVGGLGITDQTIPLLVSCGRVESDPQIRVRLLILLGETYSAEPDAEKGQEKLQERNRELLHEHADTLIKDVVVPNLVWKAGLTAQSIRTASICCLWSILRKHHQSLGSPGAQILLPHVTCLMSDDSKKTRLVSCKVLKSLLNTVGKQVDVDKLHKACPDLLKRLDDADDEVRLAAATALTSLFQSLPEKYDSSLYKAHLEAVINTCLVHLDDPDSTVQNSILEVLKEVGKKDPSLLLRQVNEVRHKHRHPKPCDDLIHHFQGVAING